jgi:hypothetical protein
MGVPLGIELMSVQEPLAFVHAGGAQYAFVADVIRSYSQDGAAPIVIFDTGIFGFYVNSCEAVGLVVGTRIRGTGTLKLDHYIWVEFLETYPDPPNLFYDLTVSCITKVRIPERFVSRQEHGKSYPTSVAPADLAAGDYEEIDTMEDQKFDEEFYIIEFESIEGKSIPRTFQGS